MSLFYQNLPKNTLYVWVGKVTFAYEVMRKKIYMNDLDLLGARNTKIWMPGIPPTLTPVIAWAKNVFLRYHEFFDKVSRKHIISA